MKLTEYETGFHEKARDRQSSGIGDGGTAMNTDHRNINGNHGRELCSFDFRIFVHLSAFSV